MNICDKIRFLKQNRQAKKLGFPMFFVSNDVIKEFRNKVKGNSNKSDLEIIKKISRNFYSGEKLIINNKYTMVGYGRLHIYFSNSLNKIYYIQNFKYCGYINQELKEKLNKIYGLESK